MGFYFEFYTVLCLKRLILLIVNYVIGFTYFLVADQKLGLGI